MISGTTALRALEPRSPVVPRSNTTLPKRRSHLDKWLPLDGVHHAPNSVPTGSLCASGARFQ